MTVSLPIVRTVTDTFRCDTYKCTLMVTACVQRHRVASLRGRSGYEQCAPCMIGEANTLRFGDTVPDLPRTGGYAAGKRARLKLAEGTPAPAPVDAPPKPRGKPGPKPQPRPNIAPAGDATVPAGESAGITEEWVDVTPELARAWLEHNENNRPIVKVRVQQYADDLRAGAWQISHQGIAFDTNGALVDGQHRLHAVIDSGITMRAHVMRGLPPSSRAVVDQGRARSVGQHVTMVDNVAGGTRIAAWCRAVKILEARSVRVVSYAALMEFRREFSESVAWMLQHGPKRRPLALVPVVAAMLYAHRAEPEKVGEFVERYVSGVGLTEDSPILALRNLVLAGGRGGTREMSLKALRAMQAHVEGEPLSLVRATEDAWEYFRKRTGALASAGDEGGAA